MIELKSLSVSKFRWIPFFSLFCPFFLRVSFVVSTMLDGLLVLVLLLLLPACHFIFVCAKFFFILVYTYNVKYVY